MNQFLADLAEFLAHSLVFFSKENWLPVADARGDGKNTASTEQEETNEQVAGQGGAAGSVTKVSGAGAGSGAGGSLVLGAGSTQSIGRQVGGVGNTSITNITNADPAVSEAALESNTDVAETAIAGISSTSGAALGLANSALGDEESTATMSIQAGVADTQMNDAFGEEALQSAADAEATSTTGLESMGTQEADVATNALAAAQNETLAGVTPAQEFQSVSPAIANSTSSKLATIGTYLTILGGIVALLVFFKTKGKAT